MHGCYQHLRQRWINNVPIVACSYMATPSLTLVGLLRH